MKKLLLLLSVTAMTGCTSQVPITPPATKNPVAVVQNENNNPVLDENMALPGETLLPTANPKEDKAYIKKILEKEYPDEIYSNLRLNIEGMIGGEIQNLAIQKQDIDICEQYLEGSPLEICVNFASSQIATEKKDPALCEKISDEMSKSNCKNQVVMTLAQESGDPAICEKIKENRSSDMMIQDESVVINRKNSIYYNLAMNKNEESFCQEIKDDFMANNCVTMVESNRKMQGGMNAMNSQPPVSEEVPVVTEEVLIPQENQNPEENISAPLEEVEEFEIPEPETLPEDFNEPTEGETLPLE